MSKIKLDEYKQEIAKFYDRRSENYDESDWHRQICDRLLKLAQVSNGQKVLDVGTGTGHLAFAAAKSVGDCGQVLGIDISPQMLKQAKNKAKASNINNVEFKFADAESLDLSPKHFERILCANTFPWIANKQDTLSLWCSLLKDDGLIGIHTPGDTAYIGMVVLQKVLAKHGIWLEPSNRIGSIEQCISLFTQAGLSAVEIKTEKHGSYTSLEKAKSWWGTIINPAPISLKIDRDRLNQLDQSQLKQIRKEFDAELEAIETKSGIWDEVPTWYVLGRKS